jgi:Major Facilitator Superfamily
MAERAAGTPAPGWRRYRPAGSVPAVRRAFTGTLISRLAQTMIPLALLLLLRQRTGSFTAAGVAVAVFGLASVAGGPVTARLAERHGPRVLAGTGLVSGAFLVVLALTTSPAVTWAAVALSGVTVPPLTAALRATVTASLAAEADRAAAFSLDAIATELLFVAGPALVGVASAARATGAALVAAGCLTAAGAALAARAAVRPAGRAGPARGAAAPVTAAGARPDPAEVGRARRWALLPWLVAGAAQMGAIGFVEVAAAARVTALGHPAAAGGVLAVWAAGSVAGGLAYGTRTWPGSPAGRLRWLLVLSGGGFAAVTAAGSMALLYPLMFTAGLACAPAAAALAACFSARASRTTAFAALAAASSLGGSAGYAAAGLLLGHAAVAGVLLTGAGLSALAAAAVPRNGGNVTRCPGGDRGLR